MPLQRLESRIEKEVMQLVTKTQKLASNDRLEEAIQSLHQAWALLPEPRTDQRCAITVAGSLGDLYCENGDFTKALEWTKCALECPGGQENPLVHLRLGQALVELGHREAGIDELVKAHDLGSRKVFRQVPPVFGILLNERHSGADLNELLPPRYQKL